MPTGSYSMSAHGEVTSENIKKMVEMYKPLKEKKMQLFRDVKELLDENDVEFWLDQGTLLGAYREKKMIAYDHDFDLAMRSTEKFKLMGTVIQERLGKKYKYEYRPHTHCLTLPIEEVGSIVQSGEERSCVWLDLYLYSYKPESDEYFFQFSSTGDNIQHSNIIFPLVDIEFENMICKAPVKTVEYLESNYGYLGPDFEFDPVTKKYKKRE